MVWSGHVESTGVMLSNDSARSIPSCVLRLPPIFYFYFLQRFFLPRGRCGPRAMDLRWRGREIFNLSPEVGRAG